MAVRLANPPFAFSMPSKSCPKIQSVYATIPRYTYEGRWLKDVWLAVSNASQTAVVGKWSVWPRSQWCNHTSVSARVRVYPCERFCVSVV